MSRKPLATDVVGNAISLSKGFEHEMSFLLGGKGLPSKEFGLERQADEALLPGPNALPSLLPAFLHQPVSGNGVRR